MTEEKQKNMVLESNASKDIDYICFEKISSKLKTQILRQMWEGG